MSSYFVSQSGGSDSNSGLSALLPFQTYAHALSVAGANDTILGNGGDTFREEVVPSAASQTFGTYGAGKPIWSGADVASSGWSAAPGTALQSDGNTVALWRFNNDLTDSSGNVRTLTTVAGSPTYVADPYENGIGFDGTFNASYPDTGNFFDFGTGSFTVEMVIRQTVASAGGEQAIVAKGGGGTPNWRLGKFGNQYRFLGGDGTHNYDKQTGASYNDNAWHHVAAVIDMTAKTAAIYVDGTIKGTTTDITGFTGGDNATALFIGKYSGGSVAITGTTLAEVRVSNVARDPTTFPTSIFAAPVNVWERTVTVQPNVVLFDTTFGTLAANVGAVSGAAQWYWASSLLYVYSTSDPASAFTAPGVQYAQRNHAFHVSAKDNTVVDGIEAQCGNQNNNATMQFDITSGGTGVGQILRNSTVRYGAGDGVMFSAFPSVATLTDSSTTGNTISTVGRNGINLFQVNATSGHEHDVSGNTLSDIFLAGIECRGNYAIIALNVLLRCGTVTQIGGAIHLYSGGIGEGTGDHNVVRFNAVTDARGHLNDGYGIAVDQWCDNNVVHHNTVNGSDGPAIYLFDAANCAIYHNTAYNACRNTAGDGLLRGGIRLTGSATSLTTSALVENNICVVLAAGAVAVYVDASTVTANSFTITNNDWWHTTGGANWYFYNATGGATLATWNAFTGVGTDLNADPLFTNAGTGDFTLQSGSPCIDAGIYIVGISTANPPDIGAFQTSTGPGLFGTVAKAAVSGVVTYTDVGIRGPGTYQLTATGGGLTSPQSIQIVVAGLGDKLLLESGGHILLETGSYLLMEV